MFAPNSFTLLRWLALWRGSDPLLRLLWAVGLALLALILCLYVSQLPAFLAVQMNADSLLAVSLIWDLRHHDYAWQGFQLPRVPSIFPDLLIQAAASFAFQSDGWAIFAYNYVQFTAFVLVIAAVVRLLVGCSFSRASTVSLATLAIVILADASLPGATGITFNYFLSCIHFGPFAASLIAAALACKLLEVWRNGTAILLFGVSTLAVLSDKLILVSFTVPATIAVLASGYLLGRGSMKCPSAIAAILVASGFTAQGLDKMLIRQPDVPIEVTQALPRFGKFLVDFAAYLPEHGLVIAVCLVLPVLFFFAFPFRFSQEVRLEERPSQPRIPASSIALFRRSMPTITVFLWLQAALAMAAVIFVTVFVAYADQGSYRYLLPALSWSIVFTSATVCRVEKLRRFIYGASVAAILAVVSQLTAGNDLRPGTVTWRFPLAECLQREKERLNLGAGFAEYWSSRPIMVASGWSLQVNQATDSGQPYLWGNDPYWYVKRFDQPEKRPQYNFIIMKKMNPEAITARFGQPERVHTCSEGEQIWIYGDDQRMTDLFLNDFYGLPEGSYRSTCSNMIRVGQQLSGQCLTERGNTRRTSINISGCLGGVANTNGELTCRRP